MKIRYRMWSARKITSVAQYKKQRLSSLLPEQITDNGNLNGIGVYGGTLDLVANNLLTDGVKKWHRQNLALRSTLMRSYRLGVDLKRDPAVRVARACDWPYVALQEILGPQWLHPVVDLTGKNIIIQHWVRALAASPQQIFRRVAVERNLLRRGLCLAVAYHLMLDGPSYVEFKILEIHVLPTERQKFTHAKARARGKKRQCSFFDAELAE